MASGWRFIQQRLKGAIRRKEARVIGDSVVPVKFSRGRLRVQLGL